MVTLRLNSDIRQAFVDLGPYLRVRVERTQVLGQKRISELAFRWQVVASRDGQGYWWPSNGDINAQYDNIIVLEAEPEAESEAVNRTPKRRQVIVQS